MNEIYDDDDPPLSLSGEGDYSYRLANFSLVGEVTKDPPRGHRNTHLGLFKINHAFFLLGLLLSCY